MHNVLSIMLAVVLTLGSWALWRVPCLAQAGEWGTPAARVIFSEEPNHAKAFQMLQDGKLDVLAYGLTDPVIQRKIDASRDLIFRLSYGHAAGLTLNPAVFNDKLNPFSARPIREALNWLVDRDYIVAAIFGATARPQFFPLVPDFPDYTRLAMACRELEMAYTYNPRKAQQVIQAEMIKMGATIRDGKWYYAEKPVEVIILIRTEDQRRVLGDYIAILLENVGFT